MSGLRREAESTANRDDESLRVLGVEHAIHLHAEFRSGRAVRGLALGAIGTAGRWRAQVTECVLRHQRTEARRPSGPPRRAHAP